MLAVACGGGDSDGDSAEAAGSGSVGATVHSDDGTLTVTVPADIDAAVEVTTLHGDDLLPDLLTDDASIVGYELSPDGVEFSGPLAIEFRVDPTALGVDLADGELPLGLVLTRSPSGEFQSLGGVFSREDGMVVASTSVTHFSPAFLVLSKSTAVAIVPDLVNLGVGETAEVKIVAGQKGLGRVPLEDLPGYRNSFDSWSAIIPFSAAKAGSTTGSISCAAPTDGVVTDAFTVSVESIPEETGFELVVMLFRDLDIFGVVSLGPSFKLSGDGTCSAASTPGTAGSAGQTPDATPSELHLTDPSGDSACEDPDNSLDPALDITGVDIVQNGDVMEVIITFDGDAEAHDMASDESFPFSFQLRLKEGTSGYPEVFFRDKSNLKVSGGLLTVTGHEFSGNKLTIRLTGRTLDDVHAVRASTFVFGGGRCEDEVKSPGYDD